ncbi:MAG TPA: patatin-like phospholipase family protein [Acidimicrobiales bacterium]|nr:patatin-like phospholipase family protein [Acidimicrobiales bacterium]
MSKALVLSGGGPVGIAWQTGLAAGLARRGVVLADAQLILGTSAGSAVGAQLALRRDLEEQLARYEAAGVQAADAAPEGTGGGGGGPTDRMARLMELLAEAAKEDGSPQETRRVVGRFALEAETFPEDRFVERFRYLAGERWPAAFRCTAVDAETGEFKVWDPGSGAELDRAVASSCAVPGIFPPITIAGRRYMDGGVRSGASVDLAAGQERVLLVTLMGGARAGADAPGFAAMRARGDREIETVREAGGTVEVLSPDPESAAVMGMNLMDPSLGPAAAAAGARQGEAAADGLRAFWAD